MFGKERPARAAVVVPRERRAREELRSGPTALAEVTRRAGSEGIVMRTRVAPALRALPGHQFAKVAVMMGHVEERCR
ncbi:hypothetical protein GCM10010412_050960 [Nonomuraea recticatena]|uniref:Uncharacterized protein n=1 Tax=Nonomuraea recticatena TaxID=46178 RepID=A0ABN3S993_9ACTN